jgi:spermidine/putrescine transport system ATP-binding protein
MSEWRPRDALRFARPMSQPATNEIAVEARDLAKRFGDVTALDGVSLSIRRGEFFSLLGPSGCGKTTFLRIVAGLEFPDAGGLSIGGAEALGRPAHLRPVNTVFQSYALFPHLTVGENVGFGLRMKKVPRAEIADRVKRVMQLVRITGLEARRPHEISGGQKQRTALARAIVNEPEVLLLDEPLGALDVKLRRELQDELHALQRRLGITFIHVTHDQDEALGLSDRVAVMNAGRVEQLGAADEIYERPRNRFVAQFVGGCNLIDGRADGRGAVSTAFGALRVQGEVPARAVTLALRPEKVLLGANAGSENRLTGLVTDTTYTGAETHCLLEVNGAKLKAATVNAAGAARIRTGEFVPLSIPPAALLILED